MFAGKTGHVFFYIINRFLIFFICQDNRCIILGSQLTTNESIRIMIIPAMSNSYMIGNRTIYIGCKIFSNLN